MVESAMLKAVVNFCAEIFTTKSHDNEQGRLENIYSSFTTRCDAVEISHIDSSRRPIDMWASRRDGTLNIPLSCPQDHSLSSWRNHRQRSRSLFNYATFSSWIRRLLTANHLNVKLLSHVCNSKTAHCRRTSTTGGASSSLIKQTAEPHHKTPTTTADERGELRCEIPPTWTSPSTQWVPQRPRARL